MVTRLFLTFPRHLVQEPVVHDLIRRFPVRANIRGASVTDEIALMAIHIDGEPADVQAAITWLKSLGISVEELAE